jgi:hypothetical protein
LFLIVATEKKPYKIMILLSSGNLTKNNLATWLENNTSALTD